MTAPKVAYVAETDQALAQMTAHRAAATAPVDVVQVMAGDMVAERLADEFGGHQELAARVVTRCSIEFASLMHDLYERRPDLGDRDVANIAANVLAFAGERLAHPRPEGAQ
jgi:hypothetical protein